MPVQTALSNPERDRLILSDLPQVRLVASQVCSKCRGQVEIEDLVSVGVIGLFQAIDRFDATRGLLLNTLADYRIRGAMLDYLRQLDPLPRSVRRFVKQRAEGVVRLTHHLGRKTGRVRTRAGTRPLDPAHAQTRMRRSRRPRPKP